MAYSCSFSIFLILLFSVHCFSNTRCYALNDQVAVAPPYPPGSGIRGICRGLVYYDLCVTSLESVPQSFTVNWAVLPLISLQLTLKNITDTKGYIEQLLLNAGGGDITSLKHCEESYGLAIQSVKTSMEQYKKHTFRGLVKNVNFATRNVTGCEKEIEKKNPDLSRSLSQKNTLSYQLLSVSYDLGIQLVHTHDD